MAVPAATAAAGSKYATPVAPALIVLTVFSAWAVAEIVPPVAAIAALVEIAAYNESAPPVKTVTEYAVAEAGVLLSMYLKLKLSAAVDETSVEATEPRTAALVLVFAATKRFVLGKSVCADTFVAVELAFTADACVVGTTASIVETIASKVHFARTYLILVFPIFFSVNII
jgi:hypothetical protein